jgi:hypothetical protein
LKHTVIRCDYPGCINAAITRRIDLDRVYNGVDHDPDYYEIDLCDGCYEKLKAGFLKTYCYRSNFSEYIKRETKTSKK